MTDPAAFTDLAKNGWWAAAGFLILVGWRSFSVGQRIGRLEQRQDDHGAKLDYLITRLDAHIDATGSDHH